MILVTPHIGCWEILGQAVGERFVEAYGPITALYRPARKTWMAELIAGSRDRRGLQTLPTSVAGVRGLMRTLRAGGYTGILPDQVPPLGQGVWAPFFGRPAYTMTLLPRLAQQTGARVFLSVCERLPRGAGYAIRFEPFDGTALNDPKATPKPRPAAMNEGIERLIRGLPGQYVWDYARYKQPRGEQRGGDGGGCAMSMRRSSASASCARWPMCRCRWCAASAPCSGRVLYVVARPRRRVVDTNLALCFPDKSPEERRRIARETFVYVAQSWLDRSWLWHAPRRTGAPAGSR